MDSAEYLENGVIVFKSKTFSLEVVLWHEMLRILTLHVI